MVTNIYFVRHAHSLYSTDELNRPLSPRGMADAEKVTEILQKQDIDIVISSPYKRAIQTIEGTSRKMGREIIIEEGFKEREISKNPLDSFDDAVEKLWSTPDFSFVGGESNKCAQKRGVDALFKVISKYQGKSIVLGTHGNIMVLMMNYFDKKFDYTFWKSLSMPDIYKLSFIDESYIKSERVWNEIDEKMQG